MKVELVGRTIPVDPTIDSQDFPAYIARIGKTKDNSDKLIAYLIKNLHFSPFEHSYLTFKIETSKAIAIQMLRHRSFNFQEVSQRYEQINEFEPFELRKEHPTNRQSSTEVFQPILTLLDMSTNQNFSLDAQDCINDALQGIQILYQALLDAGVAKESARMVLPMCTKTTLLMTGSVRSWIHYLNIRDEAHSQLEHQLIAKEIKQIFCQEFDSIAVALNFKNK